MPLGWVGRSVWDGEPHHGPWRWFGHPVAEIMGSDPEAGAPGKKKSNF